MPDIYPYGRDAPEGTYFAERRGGFDRGGGGPGEEWDPGSANNSANASAAAELARMWATAPFGVEPDATNYPGFFSSLHYATIVQNFLDASADTQVLFNDNGDIVGNANLTFNKLTGVLSMPGGIQQRKDGTDWLVYRRADSGAPIGGLYGTDTGMALLAYDPIAPVLPTATFGASSTGLAYITYTDELAINRAGGNTVLTANQDGKFLFTPYVPNQVTIEIYEGQLKLYTPYSNYLAPLNIPHGTTPSILSNGDIWTTTTGVFARVNGVTYNLTDTGSAGVTDHGALTGLADDDHTQYHNDARGDARYSLLGHVHSGADITSGTVDAARLPSFGSGAAGIVPASGGGTTNFLRADGTWAAAGGGGGTWGSITGTLSSQTDLQSALDAKAASTHTHVEQDVAGSRYHEGASAPGTISVGDEWFDTSSGILYKRIDNDGSPTWAEMNTDGPPQPSGSNLSVQYNDGGAMAGDANLTWDKTNRLFRAYGNITMNTAAPPALSSIVHGSSGNWQFAGNSLWGTTGDNFRVYSNVYYNSSHVAIAPGTSSGGIFGCSGEAWEFYTFASGSAGRTPVAALGARISALGVYVDAGRLVFPSTQIPSADLYSLDDYREGTWTPTVTALAGSFTTVSASGEYVKVGKKVTFSITITITTAGTAADILRATLPFTNGAARHACTSGEWSATGVACHSVVPASVAYVDTVKYDGTTIIGDGRVIDISGTYFV